MSRRVQRRWRRWAVYWAVTIGLQPIGTWSATKQVPYQQLAPGASDAGGGASILKSDKSDRFVISQPWPPDGAIVVDEKFICEALADRCEKAAPTPEDERKLRTRYDVVTIAISVDQTGSEGAAISGTFDIECHLRPHPIPPSRLEQSCSKQREFAANRKDCKDWFAGQVVEHLKHHEHKR